MGYAVVDCLSVHSSKLLPTVKHYVKNYICIQYTGAAASCCMRVLNLKCICMYVWGRDSSVGTATRYGLDGSEDRIPIGGGELGARFSAPFRTSPGGPPSLLYNVYRVFSGG